eukprot:4099644-Amphidinium_carterae.1
MEAHAHAVVSTLGGNSNAGELSLEPLHYIQHGIHRKAIVSSASPSSANTPMMPSRGRVEMVQLSDSTAYCRKSYCVTVLSMVIVIVASQTYSKNGPSSSK